MYLKQLPPFDIRHFIDHLQPATGKGKKGKFICPACGEDNFSISKKLNSHNVPNFGCWNDKTEQHKREIKEALRPWSEVVDNQKETVRKGSYSLAPVAGEWVRGTITPSKKPPKPAPLPSEGVVLARLAEPVTDSPKPQRKRSKQHGETLVWRFEYSSSQWVERVQWADESKPKGYDKTYRQWHSAEEGEEVPVWENSEQTGTREAVMGEPVCSKGLAPWMPYRWESAIAAVRSCTATFLVGVEGEPAAEIYWQQGYAAITLQGSDWGEAAINDLIALLKAENVGLVYHPDHDTAGYKKAELLQQACDRAGVPFLAIVPTNIDSDLAPKSDAVDMVASIGGEEFIKRLEAEIHRQVELRQHQGGGNEPPFNGGGGDDGDGGGDDGNPDNPFRQVCADMGLNFQYCCTRQQFDGSAYRVLFGGETGDWIVINSAFYCWNGRYWEHKTDTAINKLITDYGAKAFKINIPRYGQPYITRPYEDNKHKESAFKYCRSRLERETLTTNAHLLAFNDVTVDLRTGQTMPHDKAFLLTTVIPHNYQPSSECPEVFLKFVLEAFGADQLAKIRAHTSAFLDPTAPYGRVPHLIGKSGGGKGTLGRFWNSLLGEECSGSSTAFSDLSTPEGRHQHLTGKRIFGFADVGGFVQGLQAFYELVDNGAMTGRALFSPVAYQKTWNIRFWIGSVSHLQIENAADGWGRRVDPIAVIERLVIADPNLGAKLQAVKAEVIAWALAMPRSERDAILLSPPTSDRAKNLVLDAALYGDSTKSFVDLCLRPSADPTETVSHAQLYDWYRAYCQQHGYTHLGQTKFISHLRTVLSRNYVDRGWSPMVEGERSRIPAHWRGITPVPRVFVSSGGGNAEFPQNPEWTCLKAMCVEGGLEEFEAYWNPPDISLSETPESLHNAGVQGVPPQNSENQGVDSLKPLYSAGVQGGSTVQGKGFEVDLKSNDASLQVEEDSLRVKTLDGQAGQSGQVGVEPVSADSANLDKADRVDNPTLLPQDVVQRAVDRMALINSVEAFQQFYDRFERCSQGQQQQILDAFTTQVDDDEQQVRFYECWQQFETPETAAEPVQELETAQEPVKPASHNKWVYARLQAGGETLVRVLSEKPNSITVHVPGTGSKSIKPSEVIRVSDYTGD
ncbi:MULTISPECIES: hypothetical protein [Leptolyngbya]|jgi:putative DNA primase/helicase|uniref:hypothetical protein n=1 Tax=Leptolyngbya TaxID=47251 RepID=UPI000367E1F7|nr:MULTISPECIES: hypothetical protein [Leptolyngbya]MBD2371109.1 hypothetical protein [Leptolyngbya sp. FACHB-161]MBD2377577.1 hypothetical protein [Leptolyngbya sp. FACHB-238]MBD2402030.1 hypothetical protein [Leptolyngbya sp. FACHB-239]MBD2408549.1 hypothetical protein [Leptolyngbya sp. FACHB-402]BAS60450.1 hypothetical protein LBWT_Y0380 [Leptolyngbya boryana IAM M-101]